MSSAFPGGGPDFYGGAAGRSLSSSVGNNNLLLPSSAANGQHHSQALLRLQQNPQLLLQPRQSMGGIVNDPAANQIGTRRPDFIGKRSFADLQNHSQVPLLPPSNQPQNHHHQFSAVQQHQHQHQQIPLSFLQRQLYLRSVKQRTNPINTHALINNNANTNNINSTLVTSAYQNQVPSPISSIDLRSSSSSSSCSSSSSSLHQQFSSPSFSSPAETATARYGVPVYQRPRPQPVSLMTNSNCSHPNGLLSASLINGNNNTGTAAGGGFVSQNLGGNGNNNCGFINQNLGGTGAAVSGYESNFGTNRVLSDEQKPESRGNINNTNDNNNNNKIMDTLQELEKQLLDDNDEVEGDAVSVITNSEWSETFQNLMSPSQAAAAATPTTPSQAQNPNPSPTQNNLTSLSPSSSTSSCSSTATTVPAKQLISDAATAISEGKTESAVEILSRLSQLGNPTGNSEQRLVYYMCNALRSRACPSEHQPPVRELLGKEHMDSMYLLHDLSLCYKFGLFAANSIMMEAIGVAKQEESIAHVIDFDIGHGGQYKSLLRALGDRQSQSGSGWKAELKITVVTTELANNGELETVKEGLLKTAELAGVKLRFNAVNQRIRELTPESLGIEEGESLVVNFAFMLYRVPDESVSMDNLRDELLRRVKGLKPRAVTLVEQEMNGNTAPFMTRVNECVAYYGALLDLMESGPARDNKDRLRVEEGLGRKMMNSVGCDGRDRLERCEVYGKWRARMGMAGFELKPLPPSMAESMKINSSRVGDPRFTVKEEHGGVCFGWTGRALTVASAWR